MLSYVDVARSRGKGTAACRIAFAVALAVVISLVIPALAWSYHGGGYWFFQGTLPLSDGTRTVLHPTVCCDSTNWVRISWNSDPYPHYMNVILIDRSTGAWRGFAMTHFDDVVGFQVSDVSNGGCQNPDGYWPAWTNCHIGISV
jgi:hypothetical protein